MKYTIKFTTQFKRDYKLIIKKQKLNKHELEYVFSLLENGIPLPPRYKEHILKGKYNGCHECHIKPDWLLIWEYLDDVLVISMMRTGSHSKLFNR